MKKTGEKEQALGKFKDGVYDIISNNLASIIPTEMDTLIPCTCDNFLCVLLNSIIQYVLSALNRLIEEIINMVIKYLIPDWVRDLIQLIFDMTKCFMSLFTIFKTIEDINKYAEELLLSMQDRIRYYPDDVCYVPEEPFEDEDASSSSPANSTDYDDNGSGGHNQSDHHNTNRIPNGKIFQPSEVEYRPDIIIPNIPQPTDDEIIYNTNEPQEQIEHKENVYLSTESDLTVPFDPNNYKKEIDYDMEIQHIGKPPICKLQCGFEYL